MPVVSYDGLNSGLSWTFKLLPSKYTETIVSSNRMINAKNLNMCNM
jgi:hypothetical protein